MPNITDTNTIEAIAQEYTRNGRNRTEALKSVGYSPQYVHAFAGKIWANIGLQIAIKAIESETAEKAGFSREGQLLKLETAREHSQKLECPSSEVSAVRAQNKMLGYDQENAPNTESEKAILARISAEDRLLHEKYARERTHEESLDGPKLAAG